MLSRLRSEAGFTLIELLVAMTIGIVIILAAFTLIDNAVNANTQIAGRADASQRGRPAMDEITRSLRSEVCANGTAPIVSADPSQVTFTADLSDGSRVPDQRQLSYSAAGGGKITETVWPGEGTDPNLDWNTTPKTSELIADVSPDPVTVPAGAIFTYWAVTPGSGGTAFTQLGSTVAAADLIRVARVDIAFLSRPSKTTTVDKRAVNFEDSVIVRSVNPDATTPEAVCPRRAS
jgi:type II secretory pathway pseudopilin PulG